MQTARGELNSCMHTHFLNLSWHIMFLLRQFIMFSLGKSQGEVENVTKIFMVIIKLLSEGLTASPEKTQFLYIKAWEILSKLLLSLNL